MVEVSESHRGGRRGWVAAHACLKVCAGGAGGGLSSYWLEDSLRARQPPGRVS